MRPPRGRGGGGFRGRGDGGRGRGRGGGGRGGDRSNGHRFERLPEIRRYASRNARASYPGARALVDTNNPGITKPTQVAMCLKKEFDALYGPAWHCIVGKSFGSFVTHAGGGFLYFSVDKLCFLLFKTEVRPLVKPPSLHRLKINNA
ncbi:hypothetical protein CXB51_009719 [Gossypium anomalum]|uniref:Dynein light chain n=1 Tax=Gossypium anomalum TaxID=47600 RepID=A0A8J5Z229_9ROSI|nr:hypothetical protein CXB51_009719 [Gossypium anomalum]